MKPESQRIAIAEACGITAEPCTCMGGEIYRNAATKKHIPDYLSDLNAMHEAEKVLTIGQRSQYIVNLWDVVKTPDLPSYSAFTATATQRAEAFLRALNLWDDSK